MTRFRLLVFTMALVLALVAATTAAHEDAAKSDPADGSVIRTLPQHVTITFPGELDANGSSITIVGPDGNNIAATGAGVDLDNPDRNTLVMPLDGALPDGTYTVEWVALSLSDGHETSGSFSFTVDPNAAESASPEASTPAAGTTTGTTPTGAAASADDSQSEDSTSAATYVVVGVAAVAAVGAAAAAVVSGRRRKQS